LSIVTTAPIHPATSQEPTLIPGASNPRFVAVFAWYVKRLLRKKFFALRLTDGSQKLLQEVRNTEQPLLVLFTHSSWWDPLIGFFLGHKYMPERSAIAPMDAQQLQKFSFFRKVGIFGIDPENPASLVTMKQYVAQHFASNPRPSLFLTPQGRFADPRADLTIRPGAAAVAASHKGCIALAVCMEYAFWIDQNPEVFIHIRRINADGDSTPSWQRAIVRDMGEARGELASLVIARNPEMFDVIHGGPPSTNPLYDLYLRMRGRSNQISLDHRPVNENTDRLKVGS